uniref:UPAR/Ly6 domain-containing protein n=1 Tax=Mastacembelus armatus TaxID=205130 RepID=A0A7N8XBT8_9TELE
MARVLFGVIAIVASLVIVESLTCNKCSLGIFGTCFGSSNETCTTNTSVCYTGKAAFPSLSSFSGFNSQGCLDNATTCNATTNHTLLFATYQITLTCCSADKCNPVTISGSPTTKMTLTAALGAAIVACAQAVYTNNK